LFNLKSTAQMGATIIVGYSSPSIFHILTNTPDAPRANALKMSVPRRTPPSIKIGTLPSAAWTTYSR